MSLWHLWWAWVAAGLGLGLLELVIPGYVFLGVSMGAVATGLLVALGLDGTSAPVLLMVFAMLSLVSWIAVRRVAGVRRGQVKRWDRDINDT